MEYTINRLAKMSGVSARTLRYYDEIGLLRPLRVASTGYRIYGPRELEVLQQILFFRELDFPLEEIARLMSSPDFDRESAFLRHLAQLHSRRERLDALIRNVSRSLAAMKGEIEMNENEVFDGFAKRLVDENERVYGAEVREKYGDEAVDRSNARLLSMTREQHDAATQLSLDIEAALKAALEQGDPASDTAQKACDLHRQWLCVYYPDYCREYHLAMGEMYVADERFRAYYDKIAPGAAELLRDAIKIYCASPEPKA